MIRHATTILLSFAALCTAQEDYCRNPESDQITGRDLARAIPVFQAMPPGRILGASPSIGGKRIFTSGEILSLAEQAAIPLVNSRDVCFAWTLEPLKREDVLDVMHKSLNIPDASIEITALTSDRVPKGRLEFPLSGLSIPASLDQPSPVVWGGSVIYGDTRRLAIWARARIAAPVDVVVAAQALPAHSPIPAASLRVERKLRFPAFKSPPQTIANVAGMLPVRPIPAGAEIRPDNLALQNDVNRGDIIAIQAHAGRVKLTFSARAESAGRTGDIISVRNLETKKIFQARIHAKEMAIVESVTP